MVGGDGELEQKVVRHAEVVAKNLSLEDPPSTYTSRILLTVMDLLRNPDPYKQLKAEQNRVVRPIAEKAEREIDEGPEALKAALMLAAAGNVIDQGPRHSFSIDDALSRLRFVHDDSAMLMARLGRASRVMYILDNSGEVMFDMIVLKRLPASDLTIVARSSPILNDVTVSEAKDLGLERFGSVIGTGSSFLGVDLATVSDEFRQAYEQAEVVIAKGHANFESLFEKGRDCFMVLKAKCELVAEPLGVGLGESACFYSKGQSRTTPEAKQPGTQVRSQTAPGS